MPITPPAHRSCWRTSESFVTLAHATQLAAGCATMPTFGHAPQPIALSAGTTSITTCGLSTLSRTPRLLLPARSHAPTTNHLANPALTVGDYHYPDNCPQHPFRCAKCPATSPTPIARHSSRDCPLHTHSQPCQPAQPHLALMLGVQPFLVQTLPVPFPPCLQQVQQHRPWGEGLPASAPSPIPLLASTGW